MNHASTVGEGLPDASRRDRRVGYVCLLLALSPFCASAQSMTIGGGNLYVGNENSYVWEVPDIDGIDPVTILEPLTLPGTVYVSKDAYNDFARLTVRAPLTSSLGYVGYSPNGAGSATVYGPGGSWTVDGELFIGHSGHGWLRVDRGGSVHSLGATVGATYYGPGEATVTGAGSEWINVGDFVVGMESGGKLYVDNQAVLTSTGPIYVGTGWSVSTTRSAIHVRKGARLMTGGALLTGGRSEAYVQGADSLWVINGPLTLGTEARALLYIENGGAVVSNNSLLGRDPGGDGRVQITGAESLWVDFGTIEIGTDGAGLLLVKSGGRVSADKLLLGPKASVRLGTGGTITAAVQLDGGKLKLETATNAFGSLQVTANSRLEFVGDAASAVTFASSVEQAWNGVLTVAGYVAGHDSLRVGTSSIGLSPGQLARIYFAEYKVYAQIDASGYVRPAGL